MRSFLLIIYTSFICQCLCGQCDNPYLYPTMPTHVGCETIIITNQQVAGEHNITTGHNPGSNYTYTSSVATDFITLRKASDNMVLAIGTGSVSLLYQAGYGDIEMHINTNIACDTENTERTTSVIGPTCCNNLIQSPAATVDVNCGNFIIAPNVLSGTYSVSNGYEHNFSYTITSTVNSDFLVIRKNSDNSVLASGTGSVNFIYQNTMGDIEIHVNTSILCGTDMILRTINSISKSCCENINQFPLGPANPIECGQHLLINGIYAEEYNLSSGYLSGQNYLFSSTITTDFITLRSHNTNEVLATGVGVAEYFYEDIAVGDIEMHITLDSFCNTDMSSRDAYVNGPYCCQNINFYPLVPISVSECGETIITNEQQAGQYNITDGFIQFENYRFKSSKPSDIITLRSNIDNSILASGIGEASLTYYNYFGDIQMHINSNDDCGSQNAVRTTSVIANNCCDNPIRLPISPISLATCGKTLISENIKLGQYVVVTNFLQNYIYAIKSSVLTDFITIRVANDNNVIISGIGSVQFFYNGNGDLEIHINGDSICSISDNLTRTITAQTVSCCENTTPNPLTPVSISNTCPGQVISSNLLPGQYLTATGFIQDKLYAIISNIPSDFITLRKSSDGLLLNNSYYGITYLYYNNSFGDVEIHLNINEECGVDTIQRTITVSEIGLRVNNEKQINFECDTSTSILIPPFYNIYSGFSDGVSYKIESSVPTDLITVRKATDHSIIGTPTVGNIILPYTSNMGVIEIAINTSANCDYFPQETREVIITSSSCAIDTDNDGIMDASDNCLNTQNPLQSDSDEDGVGDACDNDIVSTSENVGIGNVDPKAKLHIGGNLYIDKDNGVIIMKSANKCWILKVGDDGVLSTIETDCP